MWVGVTLGYWFHVVISVTVGGETPGTSAVAVARRSFAVIAVAEFADLTQLSTAALAARSGRPVETGIGAAVALATVAGGATLAGSWLAERVPVRPLRVASAVVFATIGVVTLVGAAF